MAGQFRENWKRMANKLPPVNNGPTAFEDKDLVRVEDLDGIAGLTPSSGSLIVGSGNVWTELPLGANGFVLKSVNGLVVWSLDASGVASAPIDLSASGFVVGPASAVNGSVAIYDGTTGKLITDSLVLIDSNGNLTVGGNTIISGDLTVLGSSNIGGTIINSGTIITNNLTTNNILNSGTTVTNILNSNTIVNSGTIITNNLVVNNITNSGNVINSLTISTGTIFTITNQYYNAIVSGTTSVLMPSAPASGLTYIVKDADGVAGTTPITVDGNGNTIDGNATDQIATDYGSITLIFGNAEWNII